MPVIYQPRGKAREYAELACNLYTGCAHGFRYCYGPAIMRMTREEWVANPRPRKRILQRLDREAMALAGDDREILFSFMSDPYQSDEAARLTRAALQLCAQHHLRVTVLTKGGPLAVRDFDILACTGWSFGTSLCWIDDAKRQEWEPHAAPVDERIEAIEHAYHACGIETWLSLEPVIEPDEALAVIDRCIDIVDVWKVGKLNHDPEREAAVDWSKFAHDVRARLDGRRFYLKQSLRRFE